MDACERYLVIATREYLLDGGETNKSVVEQTLEIMDRMGLSRHGSRLRWTCTTAPAGFTSSIHKWLTACVTPPLRDKTIQDAFAKAFNLNIDRKEEIIQICEDTLCDRCDTSGLAERQAELRTDLEIVTELMQRHISANSRIAIDQAEYQRQYDEYEARFNESQQRIAEVEAHQEAMTAKRGKLKEYLDMLRKQGPIRTFNETLWCGAVEQVRMPNARCVRRLQ